MKLIYNKMENLQNEYTELQNEYTRAEQRLDFVATEAIDITKQMLKDFFNSLTEEEKKELLKDYFYSLTDEEKKEFNDESNTLLVLPLSVLDGVWLTNRDELCCSYDGDELASDLLSPDDAMTLMEAVKDAVEGYNQKRTTMNEQ